MGFESWTGKLSKLPDGTKIFPAHGAGSLCGAHLSDKPVATIGEERASNPYLKHKDVASYVMAVLDGLPEAPQYFKHNAKLNHDGPPPLKRDVLPPTLEPAAAAEQSAKGAWLVDVRDAAEFSRLHPRGAINIGIRGRFETWTGTMIPWGAPFILLGAAPEVREAASRLHRIGYDSPAGSIGGGLEAWVKAGLPTQSVALVKPVDLHGQMKQGKAPIVLDVRLPAEWMALRIGQALNIPITKLSDAGAKLDRKMPILAVCNSAYRSSMAAGVLQKLGFQDLRNLEGGSEAWITAGLPTLGPGAQAGHAPAAAVPAGVHVNLPDPISPEDLARRLLDLPGTIEVIDLRPAPQFAEFNLPGSTNAPIEQALAGEAYLADKRPLVIVCRDGYLSASVAGALVQKLTRPVRYLVGGVSRYYDEILRPKGITSAPTLLPPPGSPGAAPAAQPVPGVKPAPAPAAPAPAPAEPRKRSAGC